MTVVRICLGDPVTGERCSARVVNGSYCPAHAHRSPTTYAGALAGWRRIKRFALRRAHGHCQRCGRPSNELHVHHITPVSQGGSNRLSNALVVCPSCHKALHRRATVETRAGPG
jgi:hypothetical protein